MKVTLSVIFFTVVGVAIALGIITWYISTQIGAEGVQGGQRAISVEKCFGATLYVKNVGTLLINNTDFSVYEEDSGMKTGAHFAVSLEPGAFSVFEVVNSTDGQPVNLKTWRTDSFYAYSPGLPLAYFPCVHEAAP